MAAETLDTITYEEVEKPLKSANARVHPLNAEELFTRINDAMETGPQQAGIKLEYINGLPV